MDPTTAATSPVAPRHPRRNPLINRSYARLWGGQLVSNLGDFVFDTTLIVWIAAQLAKGQPWAPLAVSGVFLAATAPILLVGSFAGVFGGGGAGPTARQGSSRPLAIRPPAGQTTAGASPLARFAGCCRMLRDVYRRLKTFFGNDISYSREQKGYPGLYI